MNGLGGGDRIQGCAGSDKINGGTSNDGMAGGTHIDDMSGDDGDDIMHGDSGNDILAGGAGLNYLTGGPGRDLFVCSSQGETYVTDFARRTDAKIGLCISTDLSMAVAAEVERSSASTGSALSSVPQEILSTPLPLPY
jgi:Ca2+-binding RTX toxin-like protein